MFKVEVRGEDYHVVYHPETTAIRCSGTLRLRGAEEYAPIVRLFSDVADQQPETIILDLKGLRFLNSSGINVLSKFVIRVRNQKHTQLIIRGSGNFPWQGKSLKNLKRLMPDMRLELE